MPNHILSPDTQATLLLCASFGKDRQTPPQPLTLSEYNRVALWLQENSLTPADLLNHTVKHRLGQIKINQLDSERLVALLQRGMMLSLAVEQWTNQGLWIVGRADRLYPQCLKQKLKRLAPAILYGIGDQTLLTGGGLAVVGSRNVDDAALAYTQTLVQTCAQQAIQVVSGGARGVDQTSMLGTIAAGGSVVGVLADSLAKAAIAKKYRVAIQEGRLVLVSAVDPNAGFTVGNAMARNKYIYALANYALVVDSTFNSGGTWAGATEAIAKFPQIPVFVRKTANVSSGNLQLIERGAIPFPQPPWQTPFLQLIIEAIASLVHKQNESSSKVVQQPSIFTADLKAEVKSNSNGQNLAQSLESSQNLSKTVYEAVLPLILQQLKHPKNERLLAECLNVKVGQLRDWLKIAVKEDKIKKNKNPVTYELN